MLIDWFTVGAQVVNFVLLVWLLRRFLYRPILRAIDAREKLVAAELADADARKAEAHRERDELQHKTETLDAERAELLREAQEQANRERERLLAEARAAADRLSRKRMETLENDARNWSQAITRRAREEVFGIARKTLADLAAESLEERVVAVFTRRLRDLRGETHELIAKALAASPEPTLVRTAFELPPEQRAALSAALDATFAPGIRLRFERAPDLISGIELCAGGQKLAWSIDDYLGALEHGVRELLEEPTAAPPSSPRATPQAAPGSQ